MSKLALWVALVGLTPTLARASEERPPLVVLDLAAKGASELEAGAVTSGVVRGARELEAFQVLSSNDLRELLALERQKQLLGSGGESNLAMVGSRLGAKHVVTGSLLKIGTHYELELRLLDTGDGKVLAQKALPAQSSLDALVNAAPALASGLLGTLLAQEQGFLLVRGAEEGAEVVVDGRLVGSVPQAAPVALPRGMHRLEVRKEGFITRTAEVVVQRGQVAVEQVALVPSRDYARAYERHHAKLRWGAYIATGVAVASLGSALALDRLVTEPLYQKEFAPRLQALTLEARAPADFEAKAFDSPVAATCAEDTVACRSQSEALQTRIRNQQVIALGLVGAAVVAGGLATYLFVKGEDPHRYAQLVVAGGVDPRGGGMVGVAGRY